MTSPQQRTIYEFGPFRVDAFERVLMREREIIPLNLKTFQLLLALVENPGKVLTREALMQRVWPDTFVEEGNLTKGIFLLRKILGEMPSGKPYTETLPKRGYRFTAGVSGFRGDREHGIPTPESDGHARLPAPRNSFVGRQEDLSRLKERLLCQSVRLLTVTGPGGTGKTRLALEVAAQLRFEFPGGVHFVALSSLTNSAGLISAIAQCFGFSNPGGKFPSEVLREQIAVSVRAPTLLVLDNFEHLLSAVPLLSELLDASQPLTILVTSRVVLRVYGEYEYLLAPFPIPDVEHLPPLDVLAQNPAVALFMERVAAVRPDFTLTCENAVDVAGICARLDGLPLAIELATARMKLMSAANLFARLQNSLGLLTGGPHDVPERQQTLRQTIDWSYGLLTPALQTLFRRLSVFGGGCTPESAEAVCNPHLDLEVDVVDGISALIDHSLVQRVDTLPGQIRFTMLETVREYAAERLSQSGEEELTRRAHAAYCLVLAEEAHTETTPAERESWLALCDTEHHNLRAAFAWLLTNQIADWALRMAVALFDFWESREHLAEGCESLQAALRLPDAGARTRVRANALWRTGAMLGFQGDFEHSLNMHREALDIYFEVGTKAEVAFELSALAAGQMLTGDLAAAVPSYEESLRLYRELGNASQIAQTLSNLAQAKQAQGDHALARALLQEAQAIFENIEHWTYVGWCRNHLGDVARAVGDFTGARRLYEQGADQFRQHDDKWGWARSLSDLAELSSCESDYTTAHELFRQSLELFLELGHKRGVARTLEALAIDAARQGHSRRALTLAGSAAGLRQRTGSCMRPGEKRALESNLTPAWEGIDSVEGRKAWASASRMPLEAAVRYAVCRSDALPRTQPVTLSGSP